AWASVTQSNGRPRTQRTSREKSGGMPPFARHLVDGAPFADHQGPPLIAPQERAKARLLVTRFATQGALQPAPQHGEASEDIGFLVDSVCGVGQHVDETGA